MPLKSFRDSQGEEWRVWNVSPNPWSENERRGGDRRRPDPCDEPYAGPERRVQADRRRRTPGLMTPGLESGWLCFQCQSAKRRLSPVPRGWEEADDQRLEELARSARPVATRPAD